MTTSVVAKALRQDAAVLLEEYRARQWVPDPAEHELAKQVARSHWDAHFLRAALREVPAAVRAGRLADVLAPAADVVGQEADAEDAVLQLRVLVDALTARP